MWQKAAWILAFSGFAGCANLASCLNGQISEAKAATVARAECDDAVTGADAGDRAAQSAVKARVEPTQLARPPAVVTGAPGAGTGEIRQAA